MTSRFAVAAARCEVDIDREGGELVRFVPMQSGEFGRAADAARPAFEVTALVAFDDPSAIDVPTLAMRISHEQIEVAVRWELLAGRKIRKNDEVHLLDQPRLPPMKVDRLERLDPYRLTLVCGPIVGEA